eukprot:TRINITY_DN5636_c0_g1_i2.p1 TRINITY_DN5636_c0_g1~~TRINITY_DN5636_c0_g1_i2.p1  ORF type:complete len:202 (-),score=13.05 TRINITY_DN5636_c0_g1_i2:105-632(-)
MVTKGERWYGQGTLARWRKEGGFGFVRPLEGGDDIFCHVSQLRQAGGSEIKEGDRVTYTVIYDGRSGKRMAGNVTLDIGGKSSLGRKAREGDRGRPRSPSGSSSHSLSHRNRGAAGRWHSPRRQDRRSKSRSRGGSRSHSCSSSIASKRRVGRGHTSTSRSRSWNARTRKKRRPR